MKRFSTIIAASLVLAAFVATTQAQTTLYWDVTNGSPGFVTPGSFGDGTWDSVTTTNWNPNSDGSGANVTWDDAASPANNAIIDVAGGSGANGTGWVTEDAGITVAAGTRSHQHRNGRRLQRRYSSGSCFRAVAPFPPRMALRSLAKQGLRAITPNFATPYSGVIDTGTSNLTINAGGQLDINNLARLNSAGKVVLNGGTLYERNTGNGGSFISTTKNLEVNGTGTIGYDDGNTTPDNQVSILNGTIIFGTGGDPSTGGAGTLIKTGPDQVGYHIKLIPAMGSPTPHRIRSPS